MNIYNENVFNDQYANAVPVHQNFHTMRNLLFSRKQKETAQLNEIITISGVMSDFKIDPVFNKDHGLANNIYSYQSPIRIFPYYNRKKFNDKYGKDGALITLKEVLENPNMFSKRVRFKINGYIVMNIAFSTNNSGTTIVLEPSATALYQSTIDDFVASNVQWDMISEPISSFGTASKEKNKLFGTGNMIKMSDIQMNNTINIEASIGFWIVSISCSFSDPGIFIHTIGTTVIVDGISYISIPEQFKTFLFTQTSICDMYVFGISDKIAPKLLNTTEMNNHYISGEYNILDPSCVSIERINNNTSVIGRTINTSSLTFKYPNVYTSSEVFNILTPHLLMRFNKPPSYDKDFLLCNSTHSLYNPLQFPLVRYIAEYKNTNILDITLPDIVKNYIPYKLLYSLEDFMSSPYKTDFNKYMLYKLIDILHDYPARYCKLYDTINEKYRYFKYLLFHATSSPHVLNISLLNNLGEIHNEDYEMVFDEPQCYVSFNNSSGIKKEINIYVDGYRIPTKYSFIEGFMQYVYIPVSKITTSSIIELEVLKDFDNMIYSGDILINSTNVDISLPTTLGGISSSNVVFYNATSNSYINKNNFYFGTSVYRIDIYMIDDPEKRKFFSESIGDYASSSDALLFSYYTSSYDINTSISYLKTILGEFYLTINEEKIRLEKDNERVVNPSSNDFYKILDSSDCFIICDKVEYVNIPLKIATTKFFETVTGIIRNVDGKRTLQFINFRGDPSIDRFRVFLNGILLNPSDYILSIPSVYNGTVTVTYTNIPPDVANVGIVDYLPIKINRGNTSVVKDFSIEGSNYLCLKRDSNQLPISSRDMIFINGKKYPQGMGIHPITSYRSVISNNAVDLSAISICQQKHDPDVYGYSLADDIEDKLMDTDDQYTAYCIANLVDVNAPIIEI